MESANPLHDRPGAPRATTATRMSPLRIVPIRRLSVRANFAVLANFGTPSRRRWSRIDHRGRRATSRQGRSKGPWFRVPGRGEGGIGPVVIGDSRGFRWPGPRVVVGAGTFHGGRHAICSYPNYLWPPPARSRGRRRRATLRGWRPRRPLTRLARPRPSVVTHSLDQEQAGSVLAPSSVRETAPSARIDVEAGGSGQPTPPHVWLSGMGRSKARAIPKRSATTGPRGWKKRGGRGDDLVDLADTAPEVGGRTRGLAESARPRPASVHDQPLDARGLRGRGGRDGSLLRAALRPVRRPTVRRPGLATLSAMRPPAVVAAVALQPLRVTAAIISGNEREGGASPVRSTTVGRRPTVAFVSGRTC